MSAKQQQQFERGEDVERRFGLPRGFLKHRRASPGGPKHYKLGRRTVMYVPTDVQSWLEQCQCAPPRKTSGAMANVDR
jgi:hypothetical protein